MVICIVGVPLAPGIEAALRDASPPRDMRHHCPRGECFGDQPPPFFVAPAPPALLARDDLHPLDQQSLQ
jgi:hypothetical protein